MWASVVTPSAWAAVRKQTMIKHVPPASITFTRTAVLRPARQIPTSLKDGAASPWRCVPVFTYPARWTSSFTTESVCRTAHPDSPEMRLRGTTLELDALLDAGVRCVSFTVYSDTVVPLKHRKQGKK